MRDKKGPCVICDVECIYHPLNDPWCDECKGIEESRHAAEDKTGHSVTRFGVTVPTVTRPPKYAIQKADWPSFGYEGR